MVGGKPFGHERERPGSNRFWKKKHDFLERVCLEFYKIILNAKESTPNLMLYRELGRQPISVLIKPKMIGFWQRLVNDKQDKIS